MLHRNLFIWRQFYGVAWFFDVTVFDTFQNAPPSVLTLFSYSIDDKHHFQEVYVWISHETEAFSASHHVAVLGLWFNNMVQIL